MPADDGVDGVPLLSGGNPQIPKGDGDEPVQAYLAAMPGWKGRIGRHLDDLVNDVVPEARKAVRWNTPFYGIEDNGWFLSFHCFTNYVKVTWLTAATSTRLHQSVPSTNRCATSTSASTMTWTTSSSRTGSARPRLCPVTPRSERSPVVAQHRSHMIQPKEAMKTMTCRQLGGPCDHAHVGESADDVINAQDQHLRQAVADGDTQHAPALDAMKARWKRPISGMKWYRQAKRDFAALPED